MNSRHAKRKTPTAVGFRDGERVFGVDAIAMVSQFLNSKLLGLEKLGSSCKNNVPCLACPLTGP